MKYNFDRIIDRTGTNALNTDGFRGYIFHAGPEKVFPFKDEEFIRMWVADMEFAVAPEIREKIKERVDREILGYTTLCDDSYYNTFVSWCRKMYNWTFPPEELAFSTGVIPALYELVEDLVKEDEKILIITPSYGYFKHAADYSGREYVCSRLKKSDDGQFHLDLDDLAEKAADPKMKLVIWCNPHNPTGRVWTEEELRAVGDIVEKNDLWIISDEIHCDLLRTGLKHIPMAKVMETYPKLITCMSASKTFNMAGLMFSNIIIRDPELRELFKSRDKNVGDMNPISLVGQKAAYNLGGEWLNELKLYLDDNFKFVKAFIDQHLPEIEFTIPEATYLAWVDMTPYLADVDDIPDFFANEAGVLLEGGDKLFVDNANGYIRLNLAMPQSLVKEGMERILKAIKAHNSK